MPETPTGSFTRGFRFNPIEPPAPRTLADVPEGKAVPCVLKSPPDDHVVVGLCRRGRVFLLRGERLKATPSDLSPRDFALVDLGEVDEGEPDVGLLSSIPAMVAVRIVSGGETFATLRRDTLCWRTPDGRIVVWDDTAPRHLQGPSEVHADSILRSYKADKIRVKLWPRWEIVRIDADDVGSSGTAPEGSAESATPKAAIPAPAPSGTYYYLRDVETGERLRPVPIRGAGRASKSDVANIVEASDDERYAQAGPTSPEHNTREPLMFDNLASAYLILGEIGVLDPHLADRLDVLRESESPTHEPERPGRREWVVRLAEDGPARGYLLRAMPAEGESEQIVRWTDNPDEALKFSGSDAAIAAADVLRERSMSVSSPVHALPLSIALSGLPLHHWHVTHTTGRGLYWTGKRWSQDAKEAASFISYRHAARAVCDADEWNTHHPPKIRRVH